MTSKTQNSRWSNRWCVAGVVTLAVGCAGFIWGTVRDHNVTGATQSVIVRARSLLDATRAVEAVGGEVTAELEIIDGVAATLSGQALRTLRAEHHEVTTFPNASVDVAAKRKKGRGKGPTTNATDFPGVIEADRLHELGLTGRGVTVAVVDTGVHYVTELGWGLDGRLRIHPYSVTAPFGVTGNVSDKNGHGTHLSSIIANKTKTRKGKKFESVAPDVDLVAVQAFDGAGRGTYANVITGLQWILTNKDVHNIRVVNLSFSAPPRSHYWDDPINRAVRGLHLTGAVQVSGSPRTGRCEAIQAGWVPARQRRCGRHRPGPLGGDEIPVAHRVVGHGEFEHSVEHHPTAAGVAAVEAEHELIETKTRKGKK